MHSSSRAMCGVMVSTGSATSMHSFHGTASGVSREPCGVIFDQARDASYNQGLAFPPSGPVAQLGARMNGIHEVTGSIPVWSTKPFISSPQSPASS